MNELRDISFDVNGKPLPEQVVSVNREDDESFADSLAQRGRMSAHLVIQPGGPSPVLRQLKCWIGL